MPERRSCRSCVLIILVNYYIFTRGEQWMDMNPAMNTYNIPPGLDYLAQLDQILVKQVHEIFELLSGCEMKNKYLLKNSMGQEFLKAREDTDCCTRQCCGNARPFEMGFFDGQDQEVLHLYRPLRCSTCCYPCCLQSLEVSSPPGTLIGTIHQEWSFCTPLGGTFTVRNVSGDEVLKIEAPMCPCSCGGDVNFNVMSADGHSCLGLSSSLISYSSNVRTKTESSWVAITSGLRVLYFKKSTATKKLLKWTICHS
ncbi:hypothetical protein Pmani_005303 [Petrolisthes manimaculis]|uniref:Phospholipid scramblase n=1 Tax=Petrolisthes manimaculis TaxID=1843537 RepID=A0AAE1QC02_9EUCA|nr:hypothetical protein Pmani_005303 [Petrolisthes manimaculis]